MLGGQVRRELVAVLLDEVPDAEQDVGPLAQRGRAPGREGGLGRRDGRVELLDRGEVDVPGRAARWPGRRPGPRGPDVPATSWPPIQWLTRPGVVEALDFGFGDGRHRRVPHGAMASRHDTPFGRAGPAAARPSEPRARLRIGPARAVLAVRPRCGVRRGSDGDRRDRRTATSAPTPMATASQPAIGSGPAASRVAPGRAGGGAHERPARDGDAGARAVPPARSRPASTTMVSTTATTSVADALVGLGRMRRQGRRQGAPRAGPQEGRRPRTVERQALAGAAEDHRRACPRRWRPAAGRARTCAQRPTGAPSRLRHVGAGQDAADDAEAEIQPGHARVDEAPTGRPRRRPGGRGA